jgi:hypothetical protein
MIIVARMIILFIYQSKQILISLNEHISSSFMLTIEHVMVIMFGAHDLIFVEDVYSPVSVLGATLMWHHLDPNWALRGHALRRHTL